MTSTWTRIAGIMAVAAAAAWGCAKDKVGNPDGDADAADTAAEGDDGDEADAPEEDGEADSVTPGPVVVPAYSGFAAFTDCIAADGTGPLDATGTACGGDDPCMFVGTLRAMILEGVDDCAGISAADSAGAFEWVCEDLGEDVRLVSTGFEDGMGLADLVDEAAAEWVRMHLAVERDGIEIARSEDVSWWTDPVEPLPPNEGGTVAALTDAGVWVLAADATSTGYLVDEDNVAIVTAGATLSFGAAADRNCDLTTGEHGVVDGSCLVAAGGQRCLWIEGSFEGGNADRTVFLVDVRDSVVKDSVVLGGIDGLTLGPGSSDNVVEDTEAGDQPRTCVALHGASGNLLDGVSATGCGIGFDLSGAAGNRFRDVEAGLTASAAFALALGSDDNLFTGTRASENDNDAIVIDGSSGNRFLGTRIVKNSLEWDWFNEVDLFEADGTVFVDTVIAASGWDCFFTEMSGGVTVVGLLAVGCRGDSFHATDGTTGLTLTHATTLNAGRHGINVHNTGDVLGAVVANSVTAGNTMSGISLWDSTSVIVADLATHANLEYGVEIGDNDLTSFTGILAVGGNGYGECWVDSTGSPGLVDGTCANQGDSDAALETGIDLASSFVGRVVADDAANADDLDGAAVASDIDDWLSYENGFRAWGLDGTGWPDPANLAGVCELGDDCRIWDWRIAADDPVLLARHGSGAAGAACPASVHGDVAVTDFQSVPNTFLIHAVEIVDDGIGDDDGLCESGEECAFSPNIGYYQGEGGMAGTCTFSDGTVTGVTMHVPSTNGAP